MQITQSIKADVLRQNPFPVIQAKQYDANSRFLNISLFADGQPLRASQSETVRINALRADNAGNSFVGTVNEDGTVTVPLDSWILAVSGSAKLSVSVSSATTELKSFSISLYVEPAEYNRNVYEAYFNRNNPLQAGNYYIVINGEPYAFTTTMTVPVGGVVAFDSSLTKAYTFTNSSMTTELDAELEVVKQAVGTRLEDSEDVNNIFRMISELAIAVAGKLDSSEVATGAEANKVVRRLESGDITVPQTPSADTSAASKKFVLDSIIEQVASLYKPGGSLSFSQLLEITPGQSNLGYVYNITDAFVTTSAFLEGAGKSFPAGTNVVIVIENGNYYFDIFPGWIDLSNYYNKQQIDTALEDKADKSTTYTKTEVDTLLSGKSDKSTTYTKTETDSFLNDKADKSNTYTKTEIDSNLSDKADKATTYTKTETNTLLGAKASTSSIESGEIVSGKARLAEQLENVSEESGSTQTTPFVFQGTGTDDNTTETPTAPIAKHLELRGNTVVWNQLIKNTDASDWRQIRCSATVSNNTVTVTPSSGESFCVIAKNIATVQGHKYLLKCKSDLSSLTSSNNSLEFYFYTSNLSPVGGRASFISDDTAVIISPSADAQAIGFYLTTSDAELLGSASISDIQFFDLTDKLYSEGNEPTAVEQFNRDYPLPYYEHNLGQLISCQSNKLVTIDYNQFQAQDQFIKVIAGQTYRLAYWNGSALVPLTSGSISEYDGAKNLIKTTSYGSLTALHTLDADYPDNNDVGLLLTDNTHYVKITGSSNTNIMLNIAWDGSRTEYEEYIKHEYNLPDVELKSAGRIYDQISSNGEKIQRVGTKTLSQGYSIGDTITISDIKDGSSNVICKYGALSNWGTISGNTLTLTVALEEDDVIQYELETPVETTVSTFAENIEVGDFGTMEFVSSNTESATNPIIPQGNKFFYPADYSLLIDDLNNYVNGDVNQLAKKSNIPHPAFESYTIATSDWSALSNASPYDYSATVTATHTIGNDTVIELINDQPVLFSNHGFAIAAVSGQSVTIYSIGVPDASVTLEVEYNG